MSYKEYIQQSLQAYTSDYIINVVNEIDFNYNPKPNEILVVIKELAGSVVGNVKFMPIQFNIFTGANEVNNTKEILKSFVNDYSNTHTNIGLDYYKQDYSTPIDMNNFLQVGDSYRAELLITGTLMIAGNISDIRKVKINNKEVNHTSVTVTYSTSPNPAKYSNENLQRVMIANANVQITIVAYANISPFNTLISLLKTGQKSPNDTFTVDLEYTDDTIEHYNCRIISFNDNYDITNPAIRSVVFAVC